MHVIYSGVSGQCSHTIALSEYIECQTAIKVVNDNVFKCDRLNQKEELSTRTCVIFCSH